MSILSKGVIKMRVREAKYRLAKWKVKKYEAKGKN
jgi:hypothetical protein